jgi:hypothetical protein
MGDFDIGAGGAGARIDIEISCDRVPLHIVPKAILCGNCEKARCNYNDDHTHWLVDKVRFWANILRTLSIKCGRLPICCETFLCNVSTLKCSVL